MELAERKPNRLGEYDYSTSGAYFITVCTQDRRKILSQIVGGGALDAPMIQLTDAGKIVEKYILSSNRIPGITIDKFIIMPDHIHMIIQVDETAANGTSKAPSPTNAAIPHKRRQIGRPQVGKEDIPAAFLRHYPAHKNGQLNISELARVCDTSRTTAYKYKSLLEA